jgi:hypothetical protein
MHKFRLCRETSQVAGEGRLLCQTPPEKEEFSSLEMSSQTMLSVSMQPLNSLPQRIPDALASLLGHFCWMKRHHLD